MKLGQIAAVLESAAGKTYATLANGTPVFGRKGIELKKGAFVIYNETMQTQDGEGNVLETPRPVNVIGSIWDKKEDALAAKAESALLEVEERAYVANATAKVKESYKLTDQQFEKLMNAI